MTVLFEMLLLGRRSLPIKNGVPLVRHAVVDIFADAKSIYLPGQIRYIASQFDMFR
jgi:hypothetical protein